MSSGSFVHIANKLCFPIKLKNALSLNERQYQSDTNISSVKLVKANEGIKNSIVSYIEKSMNRRLEEPIEFKTKALHSYHTIAISSVDDHPKYPYEEYCQLD